MPVVSLASSSLASLECFDDDPAGDGGTCTDGGNLNGAGAAACTGGIFGTCCDVV